MLKVAYSPVYKYQLPKGHRFPMSKYELLPEQLIYEGTIKEDQFFTPGYLSEEQIQRTHTPRYWQKLKTLSLTHKEIRNIGFPISEALVDRGRYIAHGTIDCALFAFQHGVALNIAGGTHHAFADRGEGFCVFNDFAIAAHYLLDHHWAKQILIVDLDVHQGNGTAHIFRNEPRVFTFSMHGEKNYPLRKERSDMDIGLPDKTGDDFYLKILSNTLPALIEKVKPDFIFYLSGVDPLEEDKLGRLSMSMNGLRLRDELVNKLP